MALPSAGDVIVEATDQTHRHPLQHAVIAAVDAAARRDLQLWPAQQACALPGHAEGQAQQAAALAVALPVQLKAAAALNSGLQAQARGAEQHSVPVDSSLSKCLAGDATAEFPGGPELIQPQYHWQKCCSLLPSLACTAGSLHLQGRSSASARNISLCLQPPSQLSRPC